MSGASEAADTSVNKFDLAAGVGLRNIASACKAVGKPDFGEHVTLSGFDGQVPAFQATSEASPSGRRRCFGPNGWPQHDKCGCNTRMGQKTLS